MSPDDPLAFAGSVRRALAMLGEADRRALLALLGDTLREAAGQEERPAVCRALLLLAGDTQRLAR